MQTLQGVRVVQDSGDVAIAAADHVANAILIRVPIAAGQVIESIRLMCTDMDSGAAGALDVGHTGWTDNYTGDSNDGTADDDLFLSAVSSQAAGDYDWNWEATDAAPLIIYGDSEIQLTVETAPATAVAGTARLVVNSYSIKI